MIELRYPVGCVYFGSILPTIVFRSVAFPFDFEPEPSSEHLAVQDFFHQVLFFTIDDFRWWRKCRVSSRYRVGRRRGEFDYVKYRV